MATFFVLCTWTIGYFVPRSEIVLFLTLYTLLFVGYLHIYKQVDNHHNFVFYIGVGIVARAGLILVAPGLTDDLFRFFWDGSIAHLGYSPYAYTPQEMMDLGLVGEYLSAEIYPFLNSREYYSIYPPLSQALFYLATWFFDSDIYLSSIMLRLLIVSADVAIIYLLMKLLPALQFNQKQALLYALNPLVILEFSANLHGEVVMLCLFLLSFWWLLKGRWITFSLLFALSILTKLTILLLFPLFIRRLGWGKFIYSGVIVIVVSVGSYVALDLHHYFWNYIESIRLFFQRFEFNASFYYFFRWIGYQWKGYNMIYWIGPVLSLLAMAGYFFIYVLQYLNNKGLLTRALFIYTIFLLASTTVHPWYIVFPIAFCLFSNYRYPIIWSYLIIFSYCSYTTEPYHEYMSLVLAEYLLLGLVILIEFQILPWPYYQRIFSDSLENNSA